MGEELRDMGGGGAKGLVGEELRDMGGGGAKGHGWGRS